MDVPDRIFEHNRLITVEEVAEGLGIKPSTIKDWVRKKKIPYVKFGDGKKSKVMFSPRRIERWIQELSHEPESDLGKQKKSRKQIKANRKTLEKFNEFVANL